MKNKTAAEKLWLDLVSSLGCCICRRIGNGPTPAEVHHIASGTGLRSHFAVAPLCTEHHRGKSGLHGMGVKRFITLYRPPGDSEYGLLIWVNQEIATLRKLASS